MRSSDVLTFLPRRSYGSRIFKLKGASTAAVIEEKNAFILFNSGAYQLKTPAAKAAKAVAQEGTADIFAAVDAKDAGKLKAAYAAYTKNAGIDLSPAKESVMGGQGFGSDYDWKNRTPKGTVYQR